MDVKNMYILSIILSFHSCHAGETIRLQIKMKLKPFERMPMKMEIVLGNNSLSRENVWVIRNTQLEVNIPSYVIRDDHEGKPKLIDTKHLNKTKTESLLYHNRNEKATFMLKSKDNKPENFHITGVMGIGARTFQLKRSDENRTGKSLKKRKVGHYLSLEITDFYAMEVVQFDELKDHVFRVPDIKLKANPKIRKVKRSTTKVSLFVCDLILFLDYNVFSRQYQKIDNRKNACKVSRKTETIVILRELYLLMINYMNLIFSDMKDFDFRLYISLQALIVLDTPDSAKFITGSPASSKPSSANVDAALPHLRTWFLRHYKGKFDHVMLIVGVDLYHQARNKRMKLVTGVSYLNRLCTDYSFSIVEAKYGFSQTQVMMHELAHSFGMRHDGEGNKCNSLSHYIMSMHRLLKSSNAHPWHFSKCSKETMKKKIHQLIAKKGHCAKKNSKSENRNQNILPGEIYPVDKQCEIAYGEMSYFARYPKYMTNICQVMYCIQTRKKLEILSPLPTAPGTICGSHKWCILGECVYSKKVKPKTVPCLYGDAPCKSTHISCKQLVTMLPQMCGMKAIESKCPCECSLKITTDECCPYGKEVYNCKKHWCHGTRYDTFCCETCAKTEKCKKKKKHSRRQKRSSYFNLAMQRKVASLLKAMKLNEEPLIENYVAEEQQKELAKCPPMNTELYEYCHKLVFAKGNGACYDEVISQLCCQACIIVKAKNPPGCEYGDLEPKQCSQWAKEHRLVSRCVTNKEIREKICCHSCRLFTPTMISGAKRRPLSSPYVIIALYALLISLRSII